MIEENHFMINLQHCGLIELRISNGVMGNQSSFSANDHKGQKRPGATGVTMGYRESWSDKGAVDTEGTGDPEGLEVTRAQGVQTSKEYKGTAV